MSAAADWRARSQFSNISGVTVGAGAAAGGPGLGVSPDADWGGGGIGSRVAPGDVVPSSPSGKVLGFGKPEIVPGGTGPIQEASPAEAGGVPGGGAVPDGRGGVLVASLGGSGFAGGFGMLPGFSSAIGASPEGNPATLVGGPAGALTVAPVAGGMTIAAAVPAASKVQTSSWLPMETLAGSAE